VQSLSLEERIARCDEEIALCLSAACDESLSTKDRYFATMGEADWTVAKIMLERLKESAA
jgi:hypothetical protein